jgi:hypothetical protein
MDIFALNTNAVDLMRRGDLQQAISVFRVAVSELVQSVDDEKEQDIDLADKVNRSFLSVRSVPLGDTLSLLFQDHHAFSIFDRPFLIDTTDLAAACSLEGQNCLSVIMLFNMGLAYQLLGMQDLRSEQTSFKKAMKLYQMATTILGSSGDEAEGTCLVCLALSNNKGHIYSHFCEANETQHCLDNLQAGLHAFHSSNVQIFEAEYLLPFHMNVLVLHGQTLAAAGAA